MHYYKTDEEAQLPIYHCYSDTLNFTDIHFHISEILAGHEEEATVRLFSHYNYQPPFDLHSCYILITGLSQKVYHEIYEWGQIDSVCCFVHEYRPKVKELLQANGYSGDSYIFLFDGAKHYVTIFSAIRPNAAPILPMAQKINDHLQGLYLAYLFDGPSEYSNFTAVSPHITCYDDISKAFWQTKNLLSIYYFHRRSSAIDRSWLQTHARPLNHLQYDEDLAHFKETLYAADLPATLALLHALFFEHILPTMSFYECSSLLMSIRNLLISYSVICEFPDFIADDIFQCHKYPHWWSCFETVSTWVEALIRHAQCTKKHYCAITMDAILYIRTHYHSNICIETIADAIHTAPNYLSFVFKRDTGCTIHQYLTELRISKAKKLLKNATIPIKDIAGMVGFSSTKYFYSVFQKQVSISAVEYRKAHVTRNT